MQDITSCILLEDHYHVLGLINVWKQLPPLKIFEIGAISFFRVHNRHRNRLESFIISGDNSKLGDLLDWNNNKITSYSILCSLMAIPFQCQIFIFKLPTITRFRQWLEQCPRCSLMGFDSLIGKNFPLFFLSKFRYFIVL